MIGVEYEWGHCVTFVNSFDRRSVGCGVGYKYDLSRLSVGARIGAVSGYQKLDFGKHSEYMPCTDRMCAYGSPYIDFRLTNEISLETVFYITSIVLVAKFSFG